MYTETIKLKDNEKPAKVNVETGEVRVLEHKSNNIPMGKEIFEPKAVFRKDYTISWQFLKANLTHVELSAALSLAMMAKMNSNSLEPINDDAVVRDLSEILGISINRVTKVVIRLFELGVFARFQVYDPSKPYTKYWLLNPYLSFSGKLIGSDITELFSGTYIALAFKSNKVSIISRSLKKLKLTK